MFWHLYLEVVDANFQLLRLVFKLIHLFAVFAIGNLCDIDWELSLVTFGFDVQFIGGLSFRAFIQLILQGLNLML